MLGCLIQGVGEVVRFANMSGMTITVQPRSNHFPSTFENNEARLTSLTLNAPATGGLETDLGLGAARLEVAPPLPMSVFFIEEAVELFGETVSHSFVSPQTRNESNSCTPTHTTTEEREQRTLGVVLRSGERRHHCEIFVLRGRREPFGVPWSAF